MRLEPVTNRIGERILSGTHASGLKVTVAPKAGYSKAYAVFSTNFGSVDNRFTDPRDGAERTVPDGVAHFLEHKMFEDEQGDVSDRFSDLGASCNASTSFTITSYLFSATQNVEPCLDLLLDFVQEPYFTAELVAKEQGIIGQEIRMYDDDPSWRIFFNLLEALYRTHPVRINIAGTERSIAAIDPDVLFACHRAFYRPANMALTVAGNIDPDRVVALLEADLAGRDPSPGGMLSRAPADLEPVAREHVEQAMDVARPKLLLGYKDVALGGDGAQIARRDLLSGILLDALFGRSARLHEELYREGLIDESFAADYTGEAGFGFAALGGDTDEPGLLEERLKEAIAGAARSTELGEDFRRIRNKLLGKFVSLFDSPEGIAHAFSGGAFRGIDPFELVRILESLEAEELRQRAAELFQDAYCARSLILPRSGTGS